MAEIPSPGAEASQGGAPGEGRRKNRVGALLNAYYRIEGSQPTAPVTSAGEGGLDAQGFDAKRYFDSMVSAGKLPDLVKRSRDLNAEIKVLDADMQTLVYENYSKFIRATDVIRMMKGSIDGLEPDIRSLDGHLARITEHERRTEDGVSERAQKLDHLMNQQRLCGKLKVLFNLPETLQRCLDHGMYGKAVEAYCCCTPFLRQYKENTTFQKVLEEVELKMGRIRTALEERLHSPNLSVDEAVNSSLTLLDLGEDQPKVAMKYLIGRAAVLQGSLHSCFDSEAHAASTPLGKELSRDQQELQRPESVALHGACTRAIEPQGGYVPLLCDAVEGCLKLQEGRTPATLEGGEDPLELFVSARVQELCERISRLVEHKCPPTRVLVSCIHSVRDALRRLHSMMPRLLTKLFKGFQNSIAHDAMKSLFFSASSALVADLKRLHGECKRLQGSANSSLDEILESTLEEIVKTEQSMIMHGFTALTDCQPLLNLLGSDKPACQQLVRGLHGQLVVFFLAFVDTCHAYVRGQERTSIEVHVLDPSLPAVARPSLPGLDEIVTLDWSGLFALALVRIGRHLEVKAIGKVWAVARDLFAGGDAASSDLQPNAAVIKATRSAAQATITHYVLASGQRLAHFFRNSIQNKNWMTMREPRGPRQIIEMVLKEVHAFDAQLARILGDPRKPRVERRVLSRVKNSLELEMERLWAKKLQVYASVPFNRNGAVASILRIAYKALCEYVREETFATFGLQQIQVDAAFLADVTRDFVEVEDAGVLDSLLDEAVTSASRRCVNPVLMEALIVETLCDEKKKGFKFE